MARLLIYGDGGFGREMLVALKGLPANTIPGEIVFADDNSAAVEHDGIPVIRFEDARQGDFFMIPIGESRIREKLDTKCLAAGLTPWTMISPTAELGPQLEIGDAAVFYWNTLCTGFSKIGRQFQCNAYSYVAHDCVIGDFVTFGPRVSCNGNVHIGDHAYIGTGAMLRQGTSQRPLVIGEGAVVGMGAVVTKDVAPYTTVVGNPARPLDRAPLRAVEG